jgi:polynucleotide 5'-hydroxyl-kinase GRC3/NOL9
LITLGQHPALELLADANRGIARVHLAPSRHARRKTVGERRAARREAFRQYFADATTWTAPASALQGTALMAQTGPIPAGLLVGLRNREGRDIGLALASPGDPADQSLSLISPVSEDPNLFVVPGSVVLDPAFRDRVTRPPQSTDLNPPLTSSKAPVTKEASAARKT